MNLFHEYALLLAVAVPVLTLVGYNLVLAFLGEEGTLLLPSLRPYPAVARPVRVNPARSGNAATRAANEEFGREAA